MTDAKHEPAKPGTDETQELSEEQLGQVNGGVLIGLLLPAVQKVREAAAHGSVVPTDQVSLNFAKIAK